MTTYAFVNLGRWIADCPAGCGNAIALEPHQTQFHCIGGCNLVGEVVWPGDAEEITRALAERDSTLNRNWAPAGHRQAYATGHPAGQTVADLIAETHEHEEVA